VTEEDLLLPFCLPLPACGSQGGSTRRGRGDCILPLTALLSPFGGKYPQGEGGLRLIL